VTNRLPRARALRLYIAAMSGSMRDWSLYGALLLLGAALDVVCRFFPADLPFWMPWEFSWPIYLATVLSLAWYAKGWLALAPTERPPAWRTFCFVFGVLSFWFSLQSRVDYYAQHMFFIHRAQHFVLHHLGAFFIALGFAGPVLWKGMPDFLKPVVMWKPLQRTVDFLQHPVIAPTLFVAMIYFWLLPSLHTRVMLDKTLYDIMNWTMGIDGIFFWALILDPRPSPPARISSLLRLLLIILVEPLQMVLGAVLSLSMTDFYPVYEICGRVIDIPAISDQHYGGLIIWLPGTFQSFAAFIIVLVNMRLNEEAEERAKEQSARASA
jgi:putative membrane protein